MFLNVAEVLFPEQRRVVVVGSQRKKSSIRIARLTVRSLAGSSVTFDDPEARRGGSWEGLIRAARRIHLDRPLWQERFFHPVLILNFALIR